MCKLVRVFARGTFHKVDFLTLRFICLLQKSGELDSPSSFVTELRNADLKGEKRLKVLESLRVSLTSNPVRYIEYYYRYFHSFK